MEINNQLNIVLMAAFNEAQNKHHEYLTPEHLLYAALFNDEGLKIVELAGGSSERIIGRLESFFEKHMTTTDNVEPVQSISFKNIIERAIWHTTTAQKKELDIGDVFVSLLDEEDCFAAFFLKQEGITRYDLLNVISHGVSIYQDDSDLPETEPAGEEGTEESSPRKSSRKALESFTIDLTAKALEGAIDPLIGREDVLERTAQVLCRRVKNNPIHVGEPGVGKTAITEGLAQRIASGDVPKPLSGSKILQLDMGSIVAGTRFRGDFEDRMKKIISDLQKMENVILFIDEIHTIVGAGAVSGGAMDASNLLKPLLSSGKVRCIGSTTYEEYKKYFEKDRALSRRFQKIDIPEPSERETVEILQGLRERYEDFHGVEYPEETLETIVSLSAKHINDRHLPDKAIDVLDEAGSYARMKRTENDTTVIKPEDVERIIARMARIPEKSVSSSESVKLKNLEKELKSVIFGQDEAIEKVTAAIKKARAGFASPLKPIASFLFAGPTGVGKTELARQLASAMGVPIHRFDMSEYQEKHTVARLIGAPPGYVGYEEGGLLTESIRNTPHCVLLLDEIEKAHQDIFNTLLQVMDYATLTDNSGRKADFRNVIIIMTSNAGARDIGRSKMGFTDRSIDSEAVDEAVERFFSPEFRNRLDAVVNFAGLSRENILRIVSKAVDEFKEQLSGKGISLNVTDACLQFMADRGYSPKFGAREIARTVENALKSHFIDLVLFENVEPGTQATADLDGDKIVIRTEKKD